MTTPQQRIESDLKTALKAGEKERLSTLRMLLTEIKNERIRRGEELDDDAFVAVVRRAIKQRYEAAEQFEKGGREESAAKERREAAQLEAYLPQQADEAEIRKAVEGLVASAGLSGLKDMGTVMQKMMSHFGARADGKTINQIARDVLTSAE